MLILKALIGASDKEIFENVIMQDYENTFLTDRMELLLRSFKMGAFSVMLCNDRIVALWLEAALG